MLKLFKWLWHKAERQTALECINFIDRQMRAERQSHINAVKLQEAISRRYLMPEDVNVTHTEVKLNTEALKNGK